MYRLIPLLAHAVKSDVNHTVKRTKRNAILYGIAGALLVTAYALAVTALTIYVASLYDALMATMVVAASVFALAIFIIAVTMLLNQLEARKRQQTGTATKYAVTASIGLLPSLIRASGGGKVVGLGLAAILLSSALSNSKK